jgi:small conductance mechanosensitive channel
MNLITAPTPSPTPTTGVDPGLVPDDITSASSWWDWLTGVPLRVLLIVVISGLVLAVLRGLIRRVTDRVATSPPGLPYALRAKGDDDPAGPLAAARRAQRARTIGSVLRSTATIVVGSIAVILVLDALGVNIAPLLASAGIVGVAVGFGAQSLVRDTLTGLFMLLEDQYGVGDVVDVGPAKGKVEAVGLRVTKLRDDDGTLWYVPNGAMTRVGNKTQGWSTAVVELDVDYFADLDAVRAALEAAAASVAADPEVAPDVLGEPVVTGVEKLSSEAVTVRLRLRTAPARQWDVARHLRKAARAALEEADIPLSGQRDRLAEHRAAAAERDATTGGDEKVPDDQKCPDDEKKERQ